MKLFARSAPVVSICIAAVVSAGPVRGAATADLPEDHRTLATSTSYAGMEAFLSSVDGKGPVRVSVEGKTEKGR